MDALTRRQNEELVAFHGGRDPICKFYGAHEMKREAVVVDTDAYRRIKKEYAVLNEKTVAMEADIVAMKQEMKAENNALREELALLNAKIESGANKRLRPEEENGTSSSSSIETNETKQCTSCNKHWPFSSFGKCSGIRNVCSSCKGKKYRSAKKAKVSPEFGQFAVVDRECEEEPGSRDTEMALASPEPIKEEDVHQFQLDTELSGEEHVVNSILYMGRIQNPDLTMCKV